MSQHHRRISARPYRRLRAEILATTTTCHLCGHPGSQTVDALQPASKGGSHLDPNNLAPAHGIQGCPTCGRKCNQSRGNRTTPRPRTSRQW